MADRPRPAGEPLTAGPPLPLGEPIPADEPILAGEYGSIVQISISDGGVPKTPLDRATVGTHGITGDRQRNTTSHGGPERALCLFSIEVIEALQAQGHPIGPGDVGENLTLRGIDWARVVPGARLRLGDDVLVEVMDYTPPFTHIARYFHDADSRHISQKHNPGQSRVYARVLARGALSPGDPVTLVPATPA